MDNLVEKFQEYSAWRFQLVQAIERYREWMRGTRLADAAFESQVTNVLVKLADDKLSIAFVAEFSRGKSELINSIFFADYGQRILPSSAGRTTMCPTELMYDETLPPSIRLLPIETRVNNTTTSEYKALPKEWQVFPLDTSSGDGMLAAFQQVSKVKFVPLDDARCYGLYDEDDPNHVSNIIKDGMVEVSMWRHAIINFPHPLLEQGLVILDTPGLNAIGSEPELTLNLIPNAHAVLFVLAADTGVTKSDIEVWRTHIGGARKHGRLVVLNKIDSMWDELKSSEQIDAEISKQVESCARILEIQSTQVFPVSAQKGLVAKVNNNSALLQRSRLPDLERALSQELIPEKQTIVRDMARTELQGLVGSTRSLLNARRLNIQDQINELQSLRGKNTNVIAHMMVRVRDEKETFDKSLIRFQALRSIFSKLTNEVFAELGLKQLREAVYNTREKMQESAFSTGIRSSMSDFFRYVRQNLARSQEKIDEITTMIRTMYQKFNEDHAMQLPTPMGFSLKRYHDEIDRIETIYQERFGMLTILTNEKLVITQKFFDSIASRIKQTYSGANRDVEAWLKMVIAPLEGQIRENQVQLRRRIESIKHIQNASENLEERISEVVAQETETQQHIDRLLALHESINDVLDAKIGTA